MSGSVPSCMSGWPDMNIRFFPRLTQTKLPPATCGRTDDHGERPHPLLPFYQRHWWLLTTWKDLWYFIERRSRHNLPEAQGRCTIVNASMLLGITHQCRLHPTSIIHSLDFDDLGSVSHSWSSLYEENHRGVRCCLNLSGVAWQSHSSSVLGSFSYRVLWGSYRL
jgi:hypothetical protein